MLIHRKGRASNWLAAGPAEMITSGRGDQIGAWA